MNVDSALGVFDDLIDQLDAVRKDPYTNANFIVMDAFRSALTDAGMDLSYRDQLVARSQIDVTSDLTDEQKERLAGIAYRLAEGFYGLFHDQGYNDQAIALMGSQLSMNLDI